MDKHAALTVVRGLNPLQWQQMSPKEREELMEEQLSVWDQTRSEMLTQMPVPQGDLLDQIGQGEMFSEMVEEAMIEDLNQMIEQESPRAAFEFWGAWARQFDPKLDYVMSNWAMLFPEAPVEEPWAVEWMYWEEHVAWDPHLIHLGCFEHNKLIWAIQDYLIDRVFTPYMMKKICQWETGLDDGLPLARMDLTLEDLDKPTGRETPEELLALKVAQKGWAVLSSDPRTPMEMFKESMVNFFSVTFSTESSVPSWMLQWAKENPTRLREWTMKDLTSRSG